MTVNDFKRFSIVISRHKHITGAFIYKFYSPTDVGSTAQQNRTKNKYKTAKQNNTPNTHYVNTHLLV